MAKSPVKKFVISRAKAIVAEGIKEKPVQPQTRFPIIRLCYPRHGVSTLTNRIIKVIEADDQHIRGYEIRHLFDTTEGQYKTFDRKKVVGPVELMLLEPVTE